MLCFDAILYINLTLFGIGLSPLSKLMRLPSNPPRRLRAHRLILLQPRPTTLRLTLSSELLQRIHRDTILESRFICCVEENPNATPHHTKISKPIQPNTIKPKKREGGRRGERTGKAYFGTTGSLSPFAASIASLHLAVQRHHLHPGSSPIDRRLLPREAEKSRNSFVRTPASERSGLALARVA